MNEATAEEEYVGIIQPRLKEMLVLYCMCPLRSGQGRARQVKTRHGISVCVCVHVLSLRPGRLGRRHFGF